MIRTRFAPSPTGFMHVGNVRSALFPYLVAKQAGGKFILRIEDTDQAREVQGAVDTIKDTLGWLGIDWDEGLGKDGDFGPYTQSERRDFYIKWAQKLIASGRAYADIRTPDELNLLREDAKSKKRPFLARDYRPESTLEWELGMPLRFKSEPQDYKWHDEVMGDLSAGADAVDDFIIVKSDGLPTYNFAHIVDDHEMQITHVIRGLEYISSMPKYLNLYEALEIEKPVFAHVPHIMNEQGNKKLSKRDGAKSILDYRDEGYLPDAMLNFLASMGWNDGTEQEIFTRDELMAKFSLDRVQRSGARFDEKRLLWMNGQFIRKKYEEDPDYFYETITIGFAKPDGFWPKGSSKVRGENYRREVLSIMIDRLKFLTDLGDTTYFFADPNPNWQMIDDNKQLGKLNRSKHVELLKTTKEALDNSEYDAESLQETLNKLLETTGEKPGTLFSLIRFAITWAPFSPGLPETMSALGKETVVKRLQTAIDAA